MSLVEPFRVAFMQRALVEVLLLAVLGGVVGVHVVLRRMAFAADALQHTIFPGIAIAFVAGRSLLLGAMLAALASVVLLTVLARHPRVDADAALAVLISSFFALGVLVVSRRRDFQSDLTSLLFGRLLAVDRSQILQTAAAAAVVLVVLVLAHKELVLDAFDPDGAAALGLPTVALEAVLNVAVAVTVVVAVQAVGTVLVVAFVVTPAAAARLVSRSVAGMAVLAVVLSALCGWIGLALSYTLSVEHGTRLAGGATVVVLMTAVFVVVAAGARVVRR